MMRNIRKIVEQMTLEEKAAMCSGGGFLAYGGGEEAGCAGFDGE